VPESLTDLAGLRVNPADFLAAVLEAAAQPICVVDPDGLIRLANPAAVMALGFGSAAELLGRHCRDTIHRRRPDETLDSVPIEMAGGRGAVVAFGGVPAEHDTVLEAQQAALRRVSTLVAGGAASAEVFAAIAKEVGYVIGLPLIALWRYEPDAAAATVIGAWGERPHPFQAGTRWPLDGATVCAEVLKSGRPARIDDFAGVPGTIAEAAREAGIRACAGAPIVVDGDVWGALSADSTDSGPLPARIEDRLAEFTELVATTISSSASRAELSRLVDEQAALRRVATLVALGVPSTELFGAVAEELERLLSVDVATILRYEDDGTATIVADRGDRDAPIVVGTRMSLEGENVTSVVLRTGRPARIDDYGSVSGSLGTAVRGLGVRSAVGCPILVAGRLWGAIVAGMRQAEPLPAGIESGMREFTELVAIAISNIQVRSDLAASRARVAVATDEERRRVVRDLHDGAQQRLVHTVITLKLALEALDDTHDRITALMAEALEQAERATDELRELAHGILPTVLTRGGLRAGVDALASRMPVPVEIDVSVGRLPAAIEATAYFVVAEALTNVAKHALAGRAEVTARIDDGTLAVQVRDDGVGGARPDGSGLMGLADRLALLDGRLRIESPADGGTLVAAAIPLPH
jgi:signal transduction histidine kinase